ncbi:hypothetical protein Pmani_018440 [Petrolisthes manimaculis]|uniref:Regulatory protein zeste n=1 Tax=Petrolisthes manimaculis TaxID=1843537 RepID=A0AAE1PKE0_9EUCA|nr:hypothetical protein Pmani_018440 [Petrolisthes manimaculis]
MLLQEVDERRKVIMGALSPRITAKAKDNEWKAVTEAVNSISRVSRDVLEIRKKFRTFRSEVKKKAAKEKSEREVTGGGIPDTKEWKPTEEALLALNETEAIEGHSGPFENEPLPSTSAGSVATPIPLTRTHDEHAPLPNFGGRSR